MSYEPTNWKSGDTVTSAKLNKMEQGIANAGGGGALVCTMDENNTLNHTWQEIHDAVPLVYVEIGEGSYAFLNDCYSASGEYAAGFFTVNGSTVEGVYFVATSADGYPVMEGQ